MNQCTIVCSRRIATLTGCNATRPIMDHCTFVRLPCLAVVYAHGVKHQPDLAKIVFIRVKCTIAVPRLHAVHKKSSIERIHLTL